ncbi:hypothetical protein SAMN06265182_1231 [Persephonella hydrogeniphila]|uniref:Uncharacterized protein n=1 Tax=Persephonella hydrogeniphila TaxID=198703 RepID=A0A285NFF2_9AQUI|nr:hypothetical protein [Persephonella hydrogeniphila]SNZ08244.1 hypothetical protein SAMN06265182_1231 [Persephonella hydrogeniphila]
MRLNQFEKKRKPIETDSQIEEIFKELEELLRIPQKLLVKVGEIEGLLGKPLNHARKKIGNIEKNINHIRDEILKKLEE